MGVTRMQILLTDEQAARLRAMSRERQVSISALVREMVARALQDEQDRLLQQQEEALKAIRVVHQALRDAGVEPTTGEAIVEIIRKAREERANEITRNVLGRD